MIRWVSLLKASEICNGGCLLGKLNFSKTMEV
jgi:hypothetical protein